METITRPGFKQYARAARKKFSVRAVTVPSLRPRGPMMSAAKFGDELGFSNPAACGQARFYDGQRGGGGGNPSRMDSVMH